MIESMLVLIPTLFILIFLISLGFFVYQKWNIQFTADTVASNISLTYGYENANLATGEVTKEQYIGKPLYRYLIFENNRTQKWAKENAVVYGKKVLRLTSLAKPLEEENVEIVDVVDDGIARRHLVVSVTGKYRIPFSSGLEILGISGVRTYSATSIAECVDISDYMGTVNYTKTFLDLLVGSKSKVIEAIDSVLKLFQNIKNSKLFYKG